MSDQIQNQVLSVVADALEALNRRVEGFEAALSATQNQISNVASNVTGVASNVSGIQSSLSSVSSVVSNVQANLGTVTAKVAEMQASDAGLAEVLDRVTVVQQAQPPVPPAAVTVPGPDPVVAVAPVPDPAAVQAAVQAAAVQATSAAAAQAAADAQAAAAVVAAQAQAAVVAPAPDPAVVAAAQVAPAPPAVDKGYLTNVEIDLDRAFPTKNIVILPGGVGYGIMEPTDKDEVVSASSVRVNPGGNPPFDILPADFYDYVDISVVIAR